MSTFKYVKPQPTQGGRSISRMLNPRAKQGSEHVGLRKRCQPVPTGRDRFPWGKYTPAGGWPADCEAFCLREYLKAIGK